MIPRPSTNTRDAYTVFPVIDDWEKKRLTDRATISGSLQMLTGRGFKLDEAIEFLVRLFYVDLDELRHVVGTNPG